MTFSILKSEVVPLTIDFAVKHRDLPGSPTEREVNDGRIKYLTDQVKGGLAVPFNWATAQLGDKIYRVNGQHSSKALAEMDGSLPEGLVAHYTEYKVDDLVDLARLFCQFDSRKSSRTPVDISGAYQHIHPELVEIPRGIAKLSLEGYVWWAKHIEGVPVPSGDEIYVMFGQANLQSYWHFMREIYSVKTPEMKKAPIAAALYATFNLSAADARSFWADVARGGTTDDNDPATVLDAWLKDIKEDADSVPNLKPGNLYQGCIYGWNAFRDHKTLSSIRYDARKGFLKAI
jgi:hypothetical protein